MSGEAYELPETRTELMEPKLACIEEVCAVGHSKIIVSFLVTSSKCGFVTSLN
jgi:hypothetical protein